MEIKDEHRPAQLIQNRRGWSLSSANLYSRWLASSIRGCRNEKHPAFCGVSKVYVTYGGMVNIHGHAQIINLISSDKCRRSFHPQSHRDINISTTPENHLLLLLSQARSSRNLCSDFCHHQLLCSLRDDSRFVQFYLFCVDFPQRAPRL